MRLSDPVGWRADISQAADYALPADKSWAADTPAEVLIEAWFGVPAQPVLHWRPDAAELKETVLFRTLITRMESGREQRRSKSGALRRWKLQFRKDQLDGDTLWAFYLARNGPAEPFWWENIVDGQAQWVRFPETMSRRVLWKAAYESGLELIEVI